ncbi:MAG: hypothetical protein WA190_10180 [Usitatibacter sp.]
MPIIFLNPKGLGVHPMMLGLKERYGFATTPIDKPPANEAEGAKFDGGTFRSADDRLVGVSMTLHSDGIVCETKSSTEDADAFLNEALQWLSSEYDMAMPSDLPIRKLFVSEVFVQFRGEPAVFGEQVASVLEEISAAIGNKSTGPLGFFGLNLSTDPARWEKPLHFKFERQINTPFSDERYYSFAPISTNKHLALIEKLEQFT